MSISMFSEFSELSGMIGRENAATKAMIVSRNYFTSNLTTEYQHGKLSGMRKANPRPITEIPRNVFQSITDGYPDAVIESVIIDLNYDISFASEARRLGIPHGAPSVITVVEDYVNEKKYMARRYELRTKVTFGGRLRGSYSMRQGLIVLTDDYSSRLSVIDLYIEK